MYTSILIWHTAEATTERRNAQGTRCCCMDKVPDVFYYLLHHCQHAQEIIEKQP
jgi:hypothetical protein